jgi:DNA-binding response OmpR family regulator
MDKTIVWIEDDTDVIDPVVRPLERAGHQVIRLHTVREGLDAMDTMRQADLILLDIALPPADTPYDTDAETALPLYAGLSFLHQLRQASDLKTPVMVFTDLRCPQLKRTLQVLDVADIVYMPIRPSELHRRIEAVWATPPCRN